jgi:hypothetical protein
MTKEEILQAINTLPKDDRRWIKQNITLGGRRAIGETDVCYTEARRAWMRLYDELKHEHYYWTGKDSAHLKQLLAKIRAKMAEMPSPTPATDADVVANMELFCRKACEADSWVADNLSPAIINSKFNELYTKIKNGRTKPNQGVSQEYRRKLAEQLLG